MENPQAQMQCQGQPQQQGQDQQMQQIMQVVQQMVEQGMQPVEIAAQLLQQVPPETIMQVFVQMGIPQEEAQVAIQEAMQQGQQAQQPQGPGEEQMEGAASNPAEEAAEMQMMYGGKMPKRLVKRQEGGGNPEQEMQAVMGQVQQMMEGGADARQVMEQIQAAAQQGQISPEVAQAVMEQLSGQMQATDPQAPQEGTNPQMVDPNMASPDSQMMAFGGNLKKLMSKAFGGDLTPPSIDSKTYAQDRASMITNAIKNNTFKSTLDSDFPSLSGNQMMYGGDLPKAVDGFDVSKYKTADEAELAAYRYRQGLSPEEQAKFNVAETVKGWRAPEPTYEAGKNYQYDPATKAFKVVDTPAATTQQTAQGVGYPNPFGGGLYNNLYYGTSPMARFMANSQIYGAPRIKGSNLPGGMDASAFMMQTAGQNLAPGMAGKANGQDYRITGVEDIKGGLFGRKKVGVRYNIDWGNPAAVAAAQQQGTPAGPGLSGFNADANGDSIPDYLGAGTTDMNMRTAPAVGPQNQPTAPPVAATTPSAPAATTAPQMTPTGGSGMGAMEQVDEFGLPIQTPTATLSNSIAIDPATQEQMSKLGETVNNYNPQNKLDVIHNSIDYPNKNRELDQTVENTAFAALQPQYEVNNPSLNAPTLNNPTGEGYRYNQEEITKRQEIADFRKSQADKGLEWNAAQNKWVPNSNQVRRVANMFAPTVNQDVNALTSPSPSSTGSFADTNIVSGQRRREINRVQDLINSGGYQPSRSQFTDPNEAGTRLYDTEGRPVDLFGNYLQASAAGIDGANPAYDITTGANGEDIYNPMSNFRSEGPMSDFPGGINPAALSDAVQLINRAFGGMIPKAKNGMEMQSSIDVTNKNKFNPDWDAVSDMYMNTGNRLVNFMDGVNAINPERNIARMSALNTQPVEFSQMKQGLYDQAGNFIPNDIGNQVLNPTDVYYNQERQVFEYGGRVYEMGGDIELDDNELAEFQRAGFKISKV